MENWDRYLPGTCLGVPQLSDDFYAVAQAHGIRVDTLLKNLLVRADLPPIPLTVSPGVKKPYIWVGGHGWMEPQAGKRGPRRQYDVMVVGKCLGREEVVRMESFCGAGGRLLKRFLTDAGFARYPQIYLTNVLKTLPLQPEQYKAIWVKAQLPVLLMEMLIARPKYVLSLGADVSKILLKRNAKLGDVEGRWFDGSIDLRTHDTELIDEDNQFRFKILPCMHPAALEYEARVEDEQRIRATIAELASVVLAGARSEPTKSQAYGVVTTMAQLEELAEQMRHESVLGLVGVDAEWQGRHPQNAGSFLRCVQFGWKPGSASTVQLTDAVGAPAFEGRSGICGKNTRLEAFELLSKTFNAGLRVAGFFYPADYEWLTYSGWDTAKWYAPAAAVEACRAVGGFALELAVLAVDELSRMDLDDVRRRYTDIPAYKHVLTEYRTQQMRLATKAKDAGQRAIVGSGFGWIPSEILYPYAAADADVTVTASLAVMEHLDKDRFGNNSWIPYFRALRASLAAAEIMRHGMLLDVAQCKRMADVYTRIRTELVGEIRSLLHWPDLNMDSSRQVLEAVYGTRYSAKRDASGDRVSVRPPGARSLLLVPVLNNAKSPRLWSEIEAAGRENEHTPGTGAKVLGVAMNDQQGVAIRRYDARRGSFVVKRVREMRELQCIKDIRTVGQLMHTITGETVAGENSELEMGSVDDMELEGGLLRERCDDGNVRPFISMVKETGRWSASRPNLHAIPKRKEERYQKVAGARYPGPVRSMFIAPPGHLLVEVDYSSAELFMLAIASGDATLWDHCQRALLPDDDPNFLDPHSTAAVTGLHLPCKPTKKGLKSIGKGFLRDVAKCYAEGEFMGTCLGWLTVERLARLFGGGEASRQVPEGVCWMQSDAKPTALLAVHDAGEKGCVTVRSRLGYEITTSREHEHFVLRDGDVQLVKADEITTADCLLLSPRMVEDARPLAVPTKLVQAIGGLLVGRAQPQLAMTLGLLAVIGSESSWQVDGDMVCISFRPFVSEAVVDLVRKQLVEWAGRGDDGVLVRRDGLVNFYVRGSYITKALAAAKNVGWVGIPEEVMAWERESREIFVAIFLAIASRGSKRWPVYTSEQGHGRRLQLLLLSLGMLSRRSISWCEKLESAESTGLAVWQSIVAGGVADFSKIRNLRARIPGVAWRLRQIASGLSKRGAPLSVRGRGTRPVFEGSSREFTTTRRQCLEALNRLRGRWDDLWESDAKLVRRISDMLNCQLVVEGVASVDDAGVRKCYDFETTSERRRMLVCGGIVSHNSIVYGWAYGRQAPAIVIGAKEEGYIISLADAEAIVDALTKQYPDAAMFLEAASGRVANGFLCTPMGRFRRVPSSTDRKTIAKYGREFKNAPIQGGVADVVNEAAYNLMQIRRERRMHFRISLQIHDAFILTSPYNEVVTLCREVIPEAMVRRIPIVPRRLDGSFDESVEPKYMGVGIELFFRWGVPATVAELAAVGIDKNLLEVH